MKKLNKLLFLIFLLGFANLGFAQQGVIRGSVIDDTSGQSLIGVNVLVKGTSKGTSTDVEGKFELNLAPGTYDLRFTYISFQTKTIKGVGVTADEITVFENIRLQKSTEQMEEVVVTAEAVNISEAALMTKKKTSANLLDGISAEKITKTGASNAASALKKVTGVSIEGGKYVFVRGLGDRYTKTMLNSVEIPSLDPTRNSLQIDIFPTNLIENMMINKTATAALPADFTGGIVNIETIDFPETPIFDISLSMGYSPGMHFNSDFLTYEGSNTDFLGFDGGVRELPDGAESNEIPTPINGPEEESYKFVNKFNPTLGPTQDANFMDYGLSLTLGDQYSVGADNKLGYIFSATYKSSSSHYSNMSFGEYQIPADPSTNELIRADSKNGTVSKKNVLLGGLAGLAYKTGKSKLKLTAMHLQNGESKAANLFVDNSETAAGQSGYLGDSYNLEYGERSISNLLLNGIHYFNKSKWMVDWRLSPTISKMSDPDIRNTTYTLRGDDYIFNAGAGGFPTRLWRNMDEINLVGRTNIAREYELFDEGAKLKFGGSYVYKQRNYEIINYDMAFFGSQPDWTGKPEEILESKNIAGNGNGNGVIYYKSGYQIPNANAYKSNIHKPSFYVSNEFMPITDVKVELGVRAENYIQRHTGRTERYAQGDKNAPNLDNEKVLESLDFFPSANVTYNLAEDMNLRFSYSKTIARPSFRELSFAQILDPVSNRRFNGGLFPIGCDNNGNNCSWDGDLGETRIQNFDLRWEKFYKRDQLLSLSLFYKSFDDPIELVRLRKSSTTSEYQPRNVGQGQVLGGEFEFRKSLSFISPTLTNVGLSSNITVVKSTIEMTEEELNARKRYKKEGQDIDDQRQMAGQAPYIINAGLTYENPELNFDAGLFYNVKGETLVLVGGGIFPDVYSDPFHSLKFNLNKSFGLHNRYSVSLNVANILGEKRQELYKGYNAEDQNYSSYNPHRSVSIGFKYSFN